jgi:hypothetical protein
MMVLPEASLKFGVASLSASRGDRQAYANALPGHTAHGVASPGIAAIIPLGLGWR